MKRLLVLIILLSVGVLSLACNEQQAQAQNQTTCSESDCSSDMATSDASAATPSATGEAMAQLDNKAVQSQQKTAVKITFVELGSVNCIPCKKMQPVMKSIEEKYTGQVEVVFYDVWKADQRKYAEQYGIRLIPTQVFLDKDGKEIFRHEGFFPEAEIDQFLQKLGLTPEMENQKG